MKNKAKNGYFKTIIVCVCSFVGVGFISGAELWYYFARFGMSFVFGLVVFFIVSFWLFYLSFEKSSNNKHLAKTKNIVSCFSEIIISSAMISGIINCSKLFFGKLFIIFVILSVILIFIILFKGKGSFVFYNYFVISFIIFVIVFLFLNNNQNNRVVLEKITSKKAVFSVVFSIIYVFMNIAEIKPILSQNENEFSKKNKIMISLLLSLIIEILMILFIIILFCNREIVNHKLPILLLFNNKNITAKYIYFVGLIMCLISTAIACLFGVKNRLNFDKNDNLFSSLLVIIISLILGQIEFDLFIKIFYPIIAFFNFLIFIFELKFFKKVIN